jgi:hypothetical protein
MIDRLLEATENKNWSLATRLLTEHWITNSADCFEVKERAPWETQFDEKKIGEIKLELFKI